MQVRYDEGVANHISLEPCAVAREGGGEASVEEHTGEPLQRFLSRVPGAMRKATRVGGESERPDGPKQRARRQLGKPETFQFLGFTFICGQSRRGRFLLKRKSRGDRMRAKLMEVREEMRWRRHQPVREQGKWLGRVVRGFFTYHGTTQCRPRSFGLG